MTDVTPLLNAAFARHEAGDLQEATRLYKDILQQFPQQPDALHMLGVVAKQQGNNELALKLIEVALGQRTNMPLAWHNRALILRILGRKEEALQSAEQAVAVDPACADAWDMIGFLLRDKGDLEKASSAHETAVRLQPDHLKFLGNYALLLYATGKLREAYVVMQKIEARDPTLLLHNMGNILKSAGYTDRAIPYFQKSSAQFPDNDEIRITEAMARLQIGDFTEGWKIWETRPGLDPRFVNAPYWNGQPVEHLLVHEDQGLGDALQFARYLPLLKPFAKHITVQVTRVLYTLFVASFPEFTILTLDDPVPTDVVRIRMLSLPAFFQASTTNIPKFTPYLTANKRQCDRWWHILEKRPKPRIGLVWGGNPDHLNDRLRSLPFPDVVPLLQAGRGHIISLQKGAQKNGADLSAYGVYDADTFLNDFSDTTALMSEIDLLITVDTSVAHLAGALGKPVWLLLSFDPDWRWLIGREDSPWYPTMRLFRQNAPRDWQSVIEKVCAELQRFMSGDHGLLSPLGWNSPVLVQNTNAVKLD